MANINELLGGVSIANPAFNPKTKDGRLQSPTIQTNNPANNEFNAYAKGFGRNLLGMQYNLNEFANDNFAEYNVFAGPQSTREELERERAKNQGALEQFGNSLVQTFGSEIALGVVKGVADLADIAFEQGKKAYDAATGQEYHNDFTNPVSQQMEEWQEELRNNFAIYQEDPNAQLDLTSWAYLMNRMPTVASTVSLMVPGMGASKILSALGKLGKATKAGAFLSKGYNKALKVANKAGNKYGLEGLKNTYALDRTIRASADQVSTAFFMRTAENNMEAREAYKTTLDETKALLENLTPKQREDFYKRNPEYEGKDDDYIAADLAGEAGANVFAKNYPLMFFDVIQLKALKDLWKPIRNTSLTGDLARAQRESIEALAPKAVERSGAAAVGHTIKNKIKDNFGRYNNVAVSELSEGVEEAYQYVTGESSREDAIKKIRPDFEERNLSDFLSEGELWDSAFWGWMGGVTFQAIGSGVGKLSKKLRDKNELTEEEIAKNEINKRKATLDKFINTIKDLNNGIPVNVDATNMANYDPVTGELRGKLTDEQIAIEKEKLINSFAVEMGINSLQSGTFDLLKEYMSNPIIGKYIQEQSGENADAGQAINNSVVNTLNKLEGVYSKHMYRLQELNKENPFIRKKVAENNTRLEIIKDDYQQNLNALEAQINKELADFNINDGDKLYEHFRKLIIGATVNKVKDSINETKKGIDENKIDKIAGKLTLSNYEKQLNELYKLADPAFDNDPTAFEAMMNEVEHDNSYDQIIKDNKGLANKIADKVLLQNDIDNIQSLIANTDSDYNAQYEKIANKFDAMRLEKRLNAQSQLASLMDKYNEDEIYNYIGDEGAVTNITEEDKAILEDAKKILDITDIDEGVDNLKYLNAIRNEKKKKKAAANKVAITTDGKKKVVEKEDDDSKIPENDDVDDAVAEENDKEDDKVDKDNDKSPVKDKASETPQAPPVPLPNSAKQITPASSAEEIAVGAEFNSEQKLTDAENEKFEKDNEYAKRKLEESANITNNIRSIVGRIYREDKEAFISNTDDEGIKKNIKEELITKGYDAEVIEKEVDRLYDSAKKSVIRKSKNKAASLSDINGTEITNEMREDFNKVVKDYANARGFKPTPNGKYYIDIIDFFLYVASDEAGFSPEFAMSIFENVQTILKEDSRLATRGSNKAKYIVKNINKFLHTDYDAFLREIANRDKKETVVEDNLRIGLQTTFDSNEAVDKYNTVFSQLEEDSPLSLQAKTNNHGANYIEIFSNGVKIGFLSCGIQDVSGRGYWVRNPSGLEYLIGLENGHYTNSKFDPLYAAIFENNQITELYQLIQDYYNNSTSETLKEITNNESFKKYASENNIDIDNTSKVVQILMELRGILSYEYALSASSYIRSYNEWKEKQYNNFKQANKIYNSLVKGENKIYRIDKINHGLLNNSENYDKVPLNGSNIAAIGDDFQGDNDKINLGFVKEKNDYIRFKGGEEVASEFGFAQGCVVARLNNGKSSPTYIIADRNRLNVESTNMNDPHKRITENLKTELHNIITKRLDSDTTFDDFVSTFEDLFSSKGNRRKNHLFDGLTIMRKSTDTNDGFAVVKNGKILFSAYKYKNKSKGESSTITFFKYENNNTIKYSVSGDLLYANEKNYKISNEDREKYINDLVDNLVSSIAFSQSFSLLETLKPEYKKTGYNKNISKFIKIKDGQFVVTLNGKEETYGDYFDYVVKNNAYTVQTTVNKDGSNFTEAFSTNPDPKGTLYVRHYGGINIKVSDVKEGETTTKIKNYNNVRDNLKSLRNKGTGEDYLKVLGVSDETIKGLNELGLVPKNIKYQWNLSSFGFTTKDDTGKVIIKIGDNFENAAVNHPKQEGVRTLLHERIHQAILDPTTGISIKEYYTQLQNIKDIFDNYVDKLKETNPEKYKELILFTYGKEYINGLPTETLKKHYTDNQPLILEEFFIDSITNPILSNALNEIKIEEINEVTGENKTLLQKIIDTLVNLISGIKNINKDSLLAKERNIFANLTNDAAFTTGNNKKVTTDEVKSEVKPEVKPEPTIVYTDEELEKINNKTYTSGPNQTFNANYTPTDDLSLDDIDEDEDEDGSASNISGVVPIVNNSVNKFSNVHDLLRDTDITNETEIDAFLESGLINFYC